MAMPEDVNFTTLFLQGLVSLCVIGYNVNITLSELILQKRI